MNNSPSPSPRLIAIGDIHGHHAALTGLLERIQPTPDDTIVTLGDYVNRGPNSSQVLETLSTLHQTCHHVAVLGNHDEMMLDSRNDVHAEQRWILNGGDYTLESYGPKSTIDAIPAHHWEFLQACVPYHETEQFLFTHANYCWYSPLDDQPSRLLRWTSIDEEPPQKHVSDKTFIVGHTPGDIRDLGFCRCIDTKCGFGGTLTAMEVQARQIWQVTEDGQPVAEHD